MAPTHPYLSEEGPIAFAHRGGAHDGVENTLAAFGAAVSMGFQYLETDVHTTSDGVLIAFHDNVLDELTDASGVISELPWSEVRQARVAGRVRIPQLSEVLDAFPETRLNIDPKSDVAVDPLIATLRSHGALDRVCVGSFSDRRLARVAAAFGDSVCLSMGPAETARLKASTSTRLWSGRFRGRCAQVPTHRGRVRIVTQKFVARAHEHGVAVHVWTIDDEAQMHDLLDLGVDGIMSDRIDVLRQVFVERGLWR